MAVRRRRQAPPAPVASRERLVTWDRRRPVPASYLSHRDPAVRRLAEVTQEAAVAFRRWVFAEGPDREAAHAEKNAAAARMEAARRRFCE